MSVFHRLMEAPSEASMRSSTKLPWHAQAASSQSPAPAFTDDKRHQSRSAAAPECTASLAFPLLQLPLEIQLHILAFIPSQRLTRSMASTNKHCKALVDIVVQRKLLAELQSSCPLRSNVVVFEAQRPIDTLTTRHVLHFSHFDASPSEREAHNATASDVSALYATFSFDPVQAAEKKDNGQTEEPAAAPDDRDEETDNALQVAGLTYAQPTLPGVLLADRHRLRQEHVSSSVSNSGTSTPRRQHRTGSPEPRRDLALVSRGVPEAQGSEGMAGPRGRPSGEEHRRRGHGQGYEQSARAPGEARLQSTWSEPVSSSLNAFRPRDRSVSAASFTSSQSAASVDDVCAQFRAGCAAPMYRFQLDTLDSFETWILSLTVQQRRSPESDTGPVTTSVGFQQRWEKRVAEGLDRVFRDWFRPSTAPHRTSSSLDELATRTSLAYPAHQRLRSGAMHYASRSYRDTPTSSSSELLDPSLAEYIASFPASRVLEIDGEGCTMEMQPHANRDADMHPALASMSSHYYLSSSSPYVAPPNSARVEYTFHCKSVRINAARLLSTFEDIDVDASRARQAALLTKQRGRLVGLTSGGTSWTPGASLSDQVPVAPRRRGFMSGRDAAAAVVVFGSARD